MLEHSRATVEAKMQAQEMNRNLFLRLTLTGVATTVLGACGGEEPSNTTSGAGSTGGTTGSSTLTGTTGTSTSGVGTTGGTTGGGTTGGTTGTGTTGTTGTTGADTTGANTTGSTTGPGTTGGTTDAGTTSGTTGMGGQGTSGTDGSTGMETTSTGMGGAGGGMNTGSCTTGMLQIMQTSNEMHDHLPLMMDEQMQLVMIINDGGGGMLSFAGPDDHSHTLTFSMQEVMTLASGGSLMGKQSSMDNMHTHTYTLSCS